MATPPPHHPESVGASHRSAYEGSGAPEEEGMGKGEGGHNWKSGVSGRSLGPFPASPRDQR